MAGFATFMKRAFYPGFNLGTRYRASVGRLFLSEPDARTLDCGCGNGFFTAMAARRGGTALGVSFDPAQIDRCNEFKPHMDCPPDRLKFRVVNVEQMQTIAERFDQILLLEVIEHIDDDAVAMRNLAKLLKPGGILHLSTPVSRHGPMIGFLDRFDRGGHVRLGYTDDRLRSIIRAAGLDIAFQSRVGGWGVYLTPMQDWIALTLGDSHRAQGIAFAMVYPIYLLLRLIPTPYSLCVFHHIIARRPMAGTIAEG
jgi:SAM-dependent methyltransferase